MSKILIPEKHYVGLQFRQNGDLPLGYITPHGTDKAAQSRMATVDSWTKSSASKAMPSSVVDNVPMAGFRLTSDIRRGDYGAADKWRIVDPRGFELEISSSNLAMLVSDTTIENGEILDQCIWARDGGNNVLLSLGSDEYEQALLSTDIASSSTSWKQVQLGNEIVLQNGLRGRYFGKMYPIAEPWDDASGAGQNNKLSVGSASHVILETKDDDTSEPAGNLYVVANAKLSRVIDAGNLITKAEAERLAADALSNQKVMVNGNRYRSLAMLVGNAVSYTDWTLELIPCTSVNEDDYRRKTFARLADGKLVTVGRNHSKNLRLGYIVNEPLLKLGIFSYIKEPAPSRYSHNRHLVDASCEYTDASVISYYRLELSVGSKAGNQLKTHV